MWTKYWKQGQQYTQKTNDDHLRPIQTPKNPSELGCSGSSSYSIRGYRYYWY